MSATHNAVTTHETLERQTKQINDELAACLVLSIYMTSLDARIYFLKKIIIINKYK